MNARLLLVLVAALALAGCAVTAEVAPAVTGKVVHLFVPDAGATGAAVQVGGARTVADSAGNFSVSATGPYNAVAASYSATFELALYSGYYQTSATSLRMMGSSNEPGVLGLTSGTLQALQNDLLDLTTDPLNLDALQERAEALSGQIGALAVATSMGDISGTGSGAYPNLGVRLTIADGVRSLTTGVTADGGGAFTWSLTGFFWAGNEPRTVHVGAHSTDGTTHRFARTTATINPNDTTTGVVIPALAAVGTGTVSFTLNAASGTTFGAGGAIARLYPVSTSGGVAMHINALSDTTLTLNGAGTQGTGSVTGPNLGSYLAYGLGFIEEPGPVTVGVNYVNWGQVNAGASVTIPIYRSPGPVTGPTPSLDPTWTLQPQNGHTTQFLILGAAGITDVQQAQWWQVAAAGNAATLKLPLASSIGATLNNDTSHNWIVFANTHGPCPPSSYQACLIETLAFFPGYDLPFALNNRVGIAYPLTTWSGSFTTP